MYNVHLDVHFNILQRSASHSADYFVSLNFACSLTKKPPAPRRMRRQATPLQRRRALSRRAAQSTLSPVRTRDRLVREFSLSR